MEQEVKIDTTQLKQHRNIRGWTQQHLAEVSNLSLRTVQRAEKTGVVSQETISAFSAVFEIERSRWIVELPRYEKSLLFKKRSWTIAMISIFAFQIFAAAVTYFLVGELPDIWLKLLFFTDLGILLIAMVVFLTYRIHHTNQA